MRAFAAILAAGSLFTACGGSSPSLPPGDDGGSESEASVDSGSGGSDSGAEDAAADASCVNPAVGEACSATDTVCPDGISPCCRSFVWTCDSASHQWTQSANQLGCACMTGIDCGSTTCAQGQICVVQVTSGGACALPDDAGLCPNGTQPTGSCCTSTSTTYRCATPPTGCGSTLTCACATSLCQAGACQSASGGKLQCALFAP